MTAKQRPKRTSQAVRRSAAAAAATPAPPAGQAASGPDYFNRRTNDAGLVGVTRAPAEFAPETLNADARTVRATICSETPVRVYDWRVGREIDEILTTAGMTVDRDRVPLLNAHSTYTATTVLGAVDQFDAQGEETDARLTFSGASDVEPIWQRVREGILNGVSIGGAYGAGDYVDIEPTQSATVGGVEYTAGDVPLRVVTRWQLFEVSIVPIPADSSATIRSQQSETQTGRRDSARTERTAHCDRNAPNSRTPAAAGTIGVNKMLSRRALRFLRSLGLATSASETESIAFARGLAPNQLAELYRISPRSREIVGTPTEQAAAAAVNQPPAAGPVAAAAAGTDPVADVQRALQADRDRQATIRSMAGADVPGELVERACREGWTVDQAGARFFEHLRRSSPPPATYDRRRGPGIHSSDGPNVETLQAAFMLRQGCRLDDERFRSDAGRAEWVAQAASEMERGQLSAERAAIMDRAHRYRSMSLVDFCRAALQAEGRQVPSDRETMIERAFSVSSLGRIFGAVVYAQIVSEFQSYPDSTRTWCSETDWPDFRTNQPLGVEPGLGLRRHTRGSTAQHIEFKDYGERYNLVRYTGQFTIDDQDIVDDTIGVGQVMPGLIGQTAAQLRPDLIYSILLQNANLSDGVALFSTAATRLNDITSNALSIAGLGVVEQRMAGFSTLSDDGQSLRALNLTAGILIVPRAQRQLGKQTIGSPLVVSGNTTAAGNTNPHAGEYVLESDARLDNGVIDPRTGQFVAGSTARYYVAESTRSRTIQVGYLQGTGRAPVIRQQRLNVPGRWGVGWDVAMDLGAGVIDWRGMVRSA